MSKVLDAIRKREVAKFRPAPVAKPAKKSSKKAEPVVEPVIESEPVDG